MCSFHVDRYLLNAALTTHRTFDLKVCIACTVVSLVISNFLNWGLQIYGKGWRRVLLRCRRGLDHWSYVHSVWTFDEWSDHSDV